MRLFSFLGAVGLAALAALVACSSASSTGADPDAGAPPTADAAAEAAADDASAPDAAPACDETAPIAIWVDTTDGLPSRLHVPASVDGLDGVLLFDTGSETTFISTAKGSPDPTPDGGTLHVGGCSRSVMGRPYASEDARGLPGIGFFGADQIVKAQRASLDLAGGSLARFTDGGPATEGWLETPFEIVHGSILVRLKLDGTQVRLLLDTGSPDILWIGQGGKPGDVKTQTTDAAGNPVTLYHGTVSAEIVPGVVETVPIDRAPSFPYFEQRVTSEFGGDVQGLLGLTALGARVVVFDMSRSVILRKP